MYIIIKESKKGSWSLEADGLIGGNASINKKRIGFKYELNTFADVLDFCETEIFSQNFLNPERISITFQGIKCSSIGYSTTGSGNYIIMVNPDDPIHSKSFPFEVKIDCLKYKTAIVRIYRPNLIESNKEIIFKLLTICQKEFYQEKDVKFLRRKYLGKARRRYLLWLDRESKLPEFASGLSDKAKSILTGSDNKHGFLRNADKIWENLVRTENELQAI